MRTTLDIDDDVLFAAKELARVEKKRVGQVLTELARAALLQRQRTDTGEFLGFRPLPPRGVIVTNALINQIRDEDPD